MTLVSVETEILKFEKYVLYHPEYLRRIVFEVKLVTVISFFKNHVDKWKFDHGQKDNNAYKELLKNLSRV